MAQAAFLGNRNAGKKWQDPGPPPWSRWRETNRAKRAVRFIETYCRPAKGHHAGERLRLAPFQRQWLSKVLRDDVNSAVLALPRGNGKSTFLAALATWALYDAGPGGEPQIPIVAMTVNQAVRSVYGVALRMIAAEPELASRCLVYSAIGARKAANPQNGGEMFPVSNDPDGLQGLDPSLAVCDEIGFMPVESWDSLLLASGKRPSSLIVGIGTPGFDRENALWHLRQRHLTGTLPGFAFCEYMAEPGCSVLDEDAWRVANPALAAGYMDVDALRTAVALSPESHFRTFRLGQWVDGVECWLGPDGRAAWRALIDPWAMEPSAPTWAGVDVGLKHDSTAIAWVQRRDDGRRHVKARIWLPQPDGRLDVGDAMQFLRELASVYRLQGIAYDPRFFDASAQQLADEGLPMIEWPQSLERMSPAVGATFEMIKRHEVSHDGDEGFEGQVLAAVARYNERGFTLAKAKSRDRIDACVAMVMALATSDQRVALGQSSPAIHFL